MGHFGSDKVHLRCVLLSALAKPRHDSVLGGSSVSPRAPARPMGPAWNMDTLLHPPVNRYTQAHTPAWQLRGDRQEGLHLGDCESFVCTFDDLEDGGLDHGVHAQDRRGGRRRGDNQVPRLSVVYWMIDDE